VVEHKVIPGLDILILMDYLLVLMLGTMSFVDPMGRSSVWNGMLSHSLRSEREQAKTALVIFLR
jgi:hypothetical protein